jgi:WD40 repeat protein
MTIIRNGIGLRPMQIALACLLVSLAGCRESLERAKGEAPEQSIAWGDESTKWTLWGTDGSSFFAISLKPPVLDVWQWAGDTMKKRWKVDIGDGTLAIGLLLDDRWLSSLFDEQNHLSYFCIGDLKSGKVVDRRRKPQDLYIRIAGGSRNGKHLAAWAQELGKKDKNVRFGLVTPDGKGFDWGVDLMPERHDTPLAKIRRVVPSDNGNYIGVAGWKNGVLLADLKNKNILWVASWENQPGMRDASKKPKVSWKEVPIKEVDTKDLAFSPDSKMVYAGGGEGCVYGMKVETGEIVSKWWATPTGQQINGYRISTISVSPDGRFVAAGTGPTGDVYVFSTKDGSRRILPHGGSTILILSFSPDSKRLASFAPGQIKIWKMPEEPAEQQTKKAAEEKKPAK